MIMDACLAGERERGGTTAPERAVPVRGAFKRVGVSDAERQHIGALGAARHRMIGLVGAFREREKTGCIVYTRDAGFYLVVSGGRAFQYYVCWFPDEARPALDDCVEAARLAGSRCDVVECDALMRAVEPTEDACGYTCSILGRWCYSKRQRACHMPSAYGATLAGWLHDAMLTAQHDAMLTARRARARARARQRLWSGAPQPLECDGDGDGEDVEIECLARGTVGAPAPPPPGMAGTAPRALSPWEAWEHADGDSGAAISAAAALAVLGDAPLFWGA